MRTLLQWLWEQVKRVGSLLAGLCSSICTWIAAAITYLATTVGDWINDAVQGVFEFVGSPFADASMPYTEVEGNLLPYLVQFFALDTLAEYTIELAGIWLAARVARLAMVPIRALLEVL